MEKGDRIIVGVNKFQVDENIKPPLLRIDPEVEKKQVDSLTAVKQNRDSKKVNASLDHLRTAAQGNDNLMPVILEAVKEYASLGEICNILRDVFGEYRYRG